MFSTRTSPSCLASLAASQKIRAHSSRLASSFIAIARADRLVVVPAARWITTVSAASSSSSVARPSASTTPTSRSSQLKNTRFYTTKSTPEIKVGESIPADITVRHIDVAENEDVCQGLAAGKHATLTTKDLFGGKKVVVVSVPGPYTPVSADDDEPSLRGEEEERFWLRPLLAALESLRLASTGPSSSVRPSSSDNLFPLEAVDKDCLIERSSRVSLPDSDEF